MLRKKTDKNWQIIGERMPYYGVITKEEFKPEVLDEYSVNEFFTTGDKQVELVLTLIERHVVENFQPKRCLDFGCGVGRVVIPLAKRFPEVIGVDISKAMLKEAKRNCENLGLKNVSFVESDDELSKVSGKFDLVHSFIVLQHISPARGEKIFKRMLDILDENGVGVLHVTYARESNKLSERVVRWLRESVPLVQELINFIKGRDFKYPYMSMNQYDLNRLLQMLQESGCDRTVLNFTNHGGALGVVLMFQKASRDSPTFS